MKIDHPTRFLVLVNIITIAVAVLIAVTAAAMAQATPAPTTEVTVPWGSWVSNALDVALPLFLTALTGVATYVVGAYVPPWLKAIAGTAAQARVNQVLEKAVMSAVAQTKGAVLNKRLTIPVGSEVLARAAQYAVNQAPELMKTATHNSSTNLMAMLLARMEQWGIAPENFDVKTVKAGASASTFDDAIKKHLGG